MKTAIVREFTEAPLPDKRLQRRLASLAETVAADPGASFPQMARSDGELEALYRFLNNRRVSMHEILEPHRAATFERTAKIGRVGIIHDTTQFAFEGEAGEALGYLPATHNRGFLGHFALAIDDAGHALGVAGVETVFFESYQRGARRGSWRLRAYSKKADKAFERWGRMVDEVASRLPESVRAVHVMDREGDSYALLNDMLTRGRDFVVRLRQRRRPARLGDEWARAEHVAGFAKYFCEREVPLSKRKVNADLRSKNRSRKQRIAKLHLAAMPIVFRRPYRLGDSLPQTLSLNLVRVHEVDVPQGEEAVEWILMTSLPIATRADVEAVVDWYRHRWRIEEFFKALKTGCAFEKRQLESREGLLNTLALLVPIAWQLLLVRDVARTVPDAPATSALTPRQLVVLRALSKRPISKHPTIAEAMYAVAGQGGHLKRNGQPGWQTLARGLEKLWWAELGYVAGLNDGQRRHRRAM